MTRSATSRATFSYLYKSSDPAKQGLQPYDPANPAADVADDDDRPRA